MILSQPILNLVREFAKLPGIGEKTAQRLTFHLINQSKEESLKLATAVRDLKEKIILCSRCCNISCQNPCEICQDTKRDQDIICVVEQSNDLWAIENSSNYRGLYHVLGGKIAPLEGITPDKLNIKKLMERINKENIKELILATNPNVEGDATAYYINSIINGKPVKVTRIAKGIPEGSSLEYVNRFTVASALEGRRAFK